ncbi:unnamed protein product [Rhizopus microsporus]
MKLAQERDKMCKVMQEKDELKQKEIDYLLLEANAKAERYNLQSSRTIQNQKIAQDALREKYTALEMEHEKHIQDSNNTIHALKNKLLAVEKEKRIATNGANRLRFELNNANELLSRNKEELTVVKKENNELKLQADRLESSYCTLESSHKDYIEQYHKVVTENREKIQELMNQNKELENQVTELNTKLQEEKDLRHIQFKHITGIENTPAGPYSESGSHLLALIDEYQKLGKYPEEIYTDYFEIRTKYFTVLSKVEHSTAVTERLTRELNDKEALFERLYKELEDYKNQLQISKQTINEREEICQDLEQKLAKTNEELSRIKSEKEKAENALNNTTYQLQYLLVDVQKRQDPIPPPVQVSVKLLSEPPIIPNLEHDKLAFKNVSELVDLNKSLSQQVFTLKQELAAARDAANTAASEEQTSALEEAQSVILHLNQQLTERQAQLEVLQEEIGSYKKRLEQKKETSNSNIVLEKCLSQLKEATDAFATYRAETAIEIDKLRQELQLSRKSEREARNLLISAQTSATYLEQKCTSLTETIQRREVELNEARQESAAAHEQFVAKENEAQEIRESLVECNTKIKQLEAETVDLQLQLDSKIRAYDTLKQDLNETIAEKVRLNTLLENISSRIESLQLTSTKQAELSKERISKLTSELQSCRKVIMSLEKDIEASTTTNYQDVQGKYKEALGQIQFFKEKLTETEHKLSKVNQEKIIAETKLSEAEASLSRSNMDTTHATVPSSGSCDEHIHLIAELKDRVRALEEEKDEYMSIVEDTNKKITEIANEHKKYAAEANSRIEKLNTDLEARNQMVSKAQEGAQKAKEEYDALCEKLQDIQTKLTEENKELRSDKTRLELEVEEKRNQVEKLSASVEEQKLALDEIQERLSQEERKSQQAEESATKLRQELSQLESELSSTRQKLDDVKAQFESTSVAYKREAAEWAQFQESIKKYQEETETMETEACTRLEELLDKLAKWNETNDVRAGTDIHEFSRDIYSQLRATNTKLHHEKKASEAKYLEEMRKYRLLQEEYNSSRQRLDIARNMVKELEATNEKLLEQKAAEVSVYKVEVDAFRTQNISLVEDNNRLKKKIEQIEAELSTKIKETEPLVVKVAEMEARLESTQGLIEILTAKEKEWSARSAEILAKHNQVDVKEVDRMKAENEAVKSELEKVSNELQTMKASVAPLNERIKSLEAELETTRASQASLVSNANNKQRFALELKNRLMDANKKNTELESKIADLQKQLKEATAAAANATAAAAGTSISKSNEISPQKVKSLEEALKKEQEARQAAEQDAKSAETSLKKKLDEFQSLETKYAGILNRAKVIQHEKSKLSEELKALKAEQENNAKNNAKNNEDANTALVAELKEKMAAMEEELKKARQEVVDVTIEIGRLRVMHSMSQNRNKRLQEELTALKDAAPAEPAVEASTDLSLTGIASDNAEDSAEGETTTSSEKTDNKSVEQVVESSELPVDQPLESFEDQTTEQSLGHTDNDNNNNNNNQSVTQTEEALDKDTTEAEDSLAEEHSSVKRERETEEGEIETPEKKHKV